MEDPLWIHENLKGDQSLQQQWSAAYTHPIITQYPTCATPPESRNEPLLIGHCIHLLAARVDQNLDDVIADD